ncbi:Nramp family divalent metal transporter [Mangrovibacterium marinum]|uniref:Mn2+/Fe2+ NRAMP family transporter n=1 Tax=Mangrovibacterium marinum TaxID=1639118 RepID=A0A2T5C6X4_9BACT|nr:Nramp family divalent metal transporter [Mangrovibacterium marinum]PTN10652.1 Mn2+/Fe2+ NRAMP family transporter [Mangrovibacterium marinum]
MKTNFWKALGPGIIWAAAAIGVSHLVQSTRAGADYGFQLVGVVIIANILKYPFFQYGSRYAIATGESLIDGYRRMGKWVVALFLLLTIGTMFTIQAAVTSVTVGLISSVFHSPLSYIQFAILLLLLCAVVVLIGHFKTLDRLIKFVVVILSLCTVTALIAAFLKSDVQTVIDNQAPFEFSVGNVAFLIALIGWMPTAIDISVWSSLWTLAKMKATGYRPSLKESLLDFNIGYIGTTLLSLAFLGLGALVMFHSGESFANGGVQFSNQLLALYTSSIGNWSYPILAVAAIATMFSTTLTVLDAYPRVLTPILEVFIPRVESKLSENKLKFLWMAILITGAVLLISVFADQMKLLVDIATTLSFITAPVLAVLNLKAVTAAHVSSEYQPSRFMRLFSWFGIIVLSLFALYFLWLKLVG